MQPFKKKKKNEERQIEVLLYRGESTCRAGKNSRHSLPLPGKRSSPRFMQDAIWPQVWAQGISVIGLDVQQPVCSLQSLLTKVFLFYLLIFWPCLQHLEAPQPWINPKPQQWHKPLQWQRWILKPLRHKRMPQSPLKILTALNLWLMHHPRNWAIAIFASILICIYSFNNFFFFFVFLRPHSWHMEVPRLGVESEL